MGSPMNDLCLIDPIVTAPRLLRGLMPVLFASAGGHDLGLILRAGGIAMKVMSVVVIAGAIDTDLRVAAAESEVRHRMMIARNGGGWRVLRDENNVQMTMYNFQSLTCLALLDEKKVWTRHQSAYAFQGLVNID